MKKKNYEKKITIFFTIFLGWIFFLKIYEKKIFYEKKIYEKKITIFFTTIFFYKKKYFLQKNISLKVIPSILAQVGEAAKIFRLKFHLIV